MSAPAPTPTKTIPLGSLVLVTGVNGYLGLHIADQLLLAGYKVRGTVRDAVRCAWTKEYFDGKYGVGKFEIGVVEDMAREGAFDESMIGCSGVIHSATDTTFGPNPHQIITPVVAGINSTLNSAAKTPTIKSFVFTSSSSTLPAPLPHEKLHLDATMWHTSHVDLAWAPPPYTAERGFSVYAASKILAEKAAWKFIEDTTNPGFKFNTTVPCLITGTLLHPLQTRSTAGFLLGAIEGKPDMVDLIKPLTLWMIDVVDCAKMHVVALTEEDVRGERILGHGERFDWNLFVRAAKVVRPGLLGKRWLDEVDIEEFKSTVDMVRSGEVLGMAGVDGWKGLEVSLRELLDSVDSFA